MTTHPHYPQHNPLAKQIEEEREQVTTTTTPRRLRNMSTNPPSRPLDSPPSFNLPSRAVLKRTSFTVPQRIINTYVKQIPFENRRNENDPYTNCLWEVCPSLIKQALKAKPSLKGLVANYNKHKRGVNVKRWHGYLAYICVDALDLFLPIEKNRHESVPACVPPAVRRRLFINKLKSIDMLSRLRDKRDSADADRYSNIPLALSYHQNTLYCCWTALSVNSDSYYLGGSWGVDKSEIDEIYCPFTGYTTTGRTVPTNYKMRTNHQYHTGAGKNLLGMEKNKLCQQFYDVYDWDAREKPHVKEAWYLMHFEGWTYAQLSAHFGYSARSTFCMKFTRLFKQMEAWLNSPIEDFAVEDKEEVNLTPSDKLIELYSALFKRVQWAGAPEPVKKEVPVSKAESNVFMALALQDANSTTLSASEIAKQKTALYKKGNIINPENLPHAGTAAPLAGKKDSKKRPSIKGSALEKQVFICYHFLGWTPAAIAEEYRMPLENVIYILGTKWGETTMKKYLRKGLLDTLPCRPITRDNCAGVLTLQDILPHTPKMQKQRREAQARVKEALASIKKKGI